MGWVGVGGVGEVGGVGGVGGVCLKRLYSNGFLKLLSGGWGQLQSTQ